MARVSIWTEVGQPRGKIRISLTWRLLRKIKRGNLHFADVTVSWEKPMGNLRVGARVSRNAAGYIPCQGSHNMTPLCRVSEMTH